MASSNHLLVNNLTNESISGYILIDEGDSCFLFTDLAPAGTVQYVYPAAVAASTFDCGLKLDGKTTATARSLSTGDGENGYLIMNVTSEGRVNFFPTSDCQTLAIE